MRRYVWPKKYLPREPTVLSSQAAKAMLVALLVGVTSQAAISQDAYPSRPLKIVVAYAPGGANDVVARIVGQKLSDALGQPVVIENKPGAGGIPGTLSVVRAEPDGYTLLLGAGGAITINPSLYPDLPYKPQTELVPISQVATSSLVAVVNPTLPVHDLKELIAYAAKRPEGITFASPGAGTPLHLAGEMVKSLTGMQMTHVPYKGSGPALTDLLGGRVDVMFDVMATSLPLIKSGKLRAIGVSGSARDKLLPDIPTMDEQGLKGFDVTVWYGLFAPAKTSADVVKQLESAVLKLSAASDVQERLAALALTPAAEGSAALARKISEETSHWQKVVKQSGATVD
jgi:tripartite-type tricarboxylate transporter receptor subunit TctC